MRRRDPSLVLDQAALRAAQSITEQTALRLMNWRHALEDKADAEGFADSTERQLLIGLLRDKERHAVERLFRLMNLSADNDDFFRVHRGLESGGVASVSSSCELLEHLVPPSRSPGLYRLVQDLYDTDTSALVGRERSGATAEETLKELIAAQSDKLGVLACAVLDPDQETRP